MFYKSLFRKHCGEIGTLYSGNKRINWLNIFGGNLPMFINILSAFCLILQFHLEFILKIEHLF